MTAMETTGDAPLEPHATGNYFNEVPKDEPTRACVGLSDVRRDGNQRTDRLTIDIAPYILVSICVTQMPFCVRTVSQTFRTPGATWSFTGTR